MFFLLVGSNSGRSCASERVGRPVCHEAGLEKLLPRPIPKAADPEAQ